MFKIRLYILFLILALNVSAQNWQLQLTSNVYLRTWKLSTKAEEDEKVIGGANVALYQNGKLITQSTSNSDGEFTVLVPANGEFYLTVSYPGCNAKRMSINTQNVPEKISNDNFKPTFKITGGFIMVKPYPGIDYSPLKEDLVHVEYTPNKRGFDDTREGTEKGLSIVSKVYAAEDELFKRFCATNKAGDAALAKPDCPLAKKLYTEAIAMIPDEQYPAVQLAKVGNCLKDLEEAAKKAAEVKKLEEEKILADKNEKERLAKEKAEAERIAKEKELADKADKEKLAAEQALKEKNEKERLAKEKAEVERIAKEKELIDKAAKEKLAAEQAEKNKSEKERAAKEKAEAERIAKEKELTDKATKEKLAAEQAEKNKSEKESLAKEKAEAERIAKEKELADKADKEKLAAEQAEKNKSEKERAAKEKAEAERTAKEKELADKADKEKLAAEQALKEKNEKELAAKEKAEAERIAKEKAKEELEAKKKADADALAEKEKAKQVGNTDDTKPIKYETEQENKVGAGKKRDSKISVPQVIGGNKYKDQMTRANDYFKMKRYAEALQSYEEALKSKPGDVQASKRIEECKVLLPK